MRFLATLVLLSLTACSSVEKYQGLENSLTLMSYNVENLFDTKDDPDKNDEAFLPRSLKDKNPRIQAKCRQALRERWVKQCLYTDWTETKLQRKMQRLAHVILQVNQGFGPDILILEEVENKSILERFRKEYLSKANYRPAILLEGPDERGIDVGVLTRLESVGDPKLHTIEFVKRNGLEDSHVGPTRGILQADLKLPNGETLTVLGLHFPAPMVPAELRKQAITRLNEIKENLPEGRLVVAGGDTNVSVGEDLKEKLMAKMIGEKWGVSHFIGCGECRGTHYYHGGRSWSFLDALMFDKSMLPEGNANWVVLPNSVRVPTFSKYQLNRWGSPARFGSGDRTTGVSDHWPIVANITLRSQAKKGSQ